MQHDETAYFHRRAEAELVMAQKAENPAAVKAHYTLAGHYLDRVYGPANDTSPPQLNR